MNHQKRCSSIKSIKTYRRKTEYITKTNLQFLFESKKLSETLITRHSSKKKEVRKMLEQILVFILGKLSARHIFNLLKKLSPEQLFMLLILVVVCLTITAIVTYTK
jgi:hypothetical protein